MVSEIRSELGPIDTLVNNATYRPIKPLLDLTVDDIDRAMNVNFRGTLSQPSTSFPTCWIAAAVR